MSNMRIIGGRHRGKRLISPPDRSIRPTSERAREALFNVLDHGDRIAGKRVLDLFCGTGALGLEAFSRGALEVWLIDHEITLANANTKALGQPDGVKVLRMDATRLGNARNCFDVVLMDPPYRSDLAPKALSALARGWLAEGALVVVELAAKEALDPPAGFAHEQDRHYGAARLVFLRWEGTGGEDRPS